MKTPELKTFVAALCLATTFLSAQAAKPNVIVLYYDDMGYGDMGANAESPHASMTPNLDRFAEEGMPNVRLVRIDDWLQLDILFNIPRSGCLSGNDSIVIIRATVLLYSAVDSLRHYLACCGEPRAHRGL